ncbi:MAG: hypothetical protein ACTSX8_01660 [Alphaproteobacteria bacterium]
MTRSNRCGANRAVVKEFKGVTAARAMMIEMIPRARQLTNKTAPILSGIEVIAE